MKILLLLIVAFPMLGLSQDSLYIKSEVVELPRKQSELYSKAKKWFASTFKNPEKVIKFSDSTEVFASVATYAEYTTFIGKKKTEIPDYATVTFDIRIKFKEGKYKYEFSNFLATSSRGLKFGAINTTDKCPVVWVTETQASMDGYWKSIRESIISQVAKLADNIKTSMSKTDEF